MKFPVDFVKFTEKILNGKLHFFCAVWLLHVSWSPLPQKATEDLERYL